MIRVYCIHAFFFLEWGRGEVVMVYEKSVLYALFCSLLTLRHIPDHAIFSVVYNVLQDSAIVAYFEKQYVKSFVSLFFFFFGFCYTFGSKDLNTRHAFAWSLSLPWSICCSNPYNTVTSAWCSFSIEMYLQSNYDMKRLWRRNKCIKHNWIQNDSFWHTLKLN